MGVKVLFLLRISLLFTLKTDSNYKMSVIFCDFFFTFFINKCENKDLKKQFITDNETDTNRKL